MLSAKVDSMVLDGMQAVILAGGLGSRLSEETHLRPKPMVEIGGKPILWHILKIYSHYGINDFIICCGYKGYVIKEYFANYFLHTSDVTFHMADGRMEVHRQQAEPWTITLVDTGETTLTGGRCLEYGSIFVTTAFVLHTVMVWLISIASTCCTSHKVSDGHPHRCGPGRYGVVELDVTK